MISTTVETDKPELEIRPAVDLLGNILEMFAQINPVFEPVDDGTADNLFVTKSYDATSHFEQTSEEVLELYQRITGEKLDLNIEVNEEDDD